jgi:hypothetical protein
MLKQPTVEECAGVDGGATAMALVGHAAFGDVKSIGIRQDMARRELAELEVLLKSELSFGKLTDQRMVQTLRKAVVVWKNVLAYSEQFKAKVAAMTPAAEAKYNRELHRQAEARKAARAK